MKPAITILIFMIITTGNSYSQHPTTVLGVILDTTGVALPNATVHVTSVGLDLSLISRQNGAFSFKLDSQDIFKLGVTMKGYSAFETTYNIPPGTRVLNLHSLVLHPIYQELETVTVDYIRPITVKEDTIEFRASAYPMRAGEELEHLLRALPGMITDTGGNILIEGKKISRLQINGRDYIGGDLSTALRNLPADIIDKIQVIDDYGDKARLTGVKSGSPEKVVNIILKKTKKNGFIANIEDGVGNENKYLAKGYANTFTGDRQITLNSKLINDNPTGNIREQLAAASYSDTWSNKLSGSSALGYWGNDQTLSGESDEISYYPGVTKNAKQSRTFSGQNNNLNYTNTVLYRPETNSLLRIATTFSLSKNFQATTSRTTATENSGGSLRTTNSETTSYGRSNGFSTGSVVYYEKKNPISGNKLTIEASYLYSSQDRHLANLDSTAVLFNGNISASPQINAIRSSNYQHSLVTDISYFASLSPKSLLELAYSLNISSSKDGLITYIQNTPATTLVPSDSLSNTYSLQNTVNTFYLRYLAHLSRLNLSIGIGAQPELQSGKTAAKATSQANQYFNLLPEAELSYDLSQRKKLICNYKTISILPSLQQLQPVTDLTNPLYPVQGNPQLKAAYNQTAQFRYTQSSIRPTRSFGFEIGLTYNTIKNMVISNYKYPDDSSKYIQKTTYENKNGFTTMELDYRLELPDVSKIKIILDGNVSRSQAGNLVNDNFFKTTNVLFSQGITTNINIPNCLELVAGASYSLAHTQYSPATTAPTWFSSFTWVANCRHILLKSWQLIYSIRQAYTSTLNDGLSANPIFADFQIKRDILKLNKANFTLSIKNLFNHGAGATQSLSATTLTQNETHYIGRYFLISINFKLEHFKNK